MAKKRRKSTPLPNPGDAFLMPLEDGRFGFCRVLRESRASERKFHGCRCLLVAASPWIGKKAPRLTDPRLRELHRLTHHEHKNSRNMCWVSDPAPASFRLLGSIAPTPGDKRMQCMEFGGWCFEWHLFMQWRWDHERQTVLREDEEEQKHQMLEYEKSLKQEEKRLADLSLERLRKKRRLSKWKSYVPDTVINACQKVFDQTIAALLQLGPKPKKQKALGILRECIEDLNGLDEKYDFIETIEREDLCAEFDDIAYACGLREENLADRWREW